MSVYKHGNWWYYDFTLDGTRYRGKAGRTKSQARRAEDKFRGMAMAGELEVEIRSTIRIEDFAEIYLRRRSSLRSSRRDGYSVKALLSYFRGKTLQGITVENIEDYKILRLKSGVTHGTVNRELAALSKMYNCAIAWSDSGYTKKVNPVLSIEKLKEPPGRTRYLTKEEIARLLAGL